MVDGNSSSQAADPKLEKTTNFRSQAPDNQEINEDIIHQTHKIFNFKFQNCHGCTVYMPVDSLNATSSVRMDNCGNNAPQVTYHRPRIINEKVLHSQSHAVSNGSQNATGLPTEFARGDLSNMHLQMNAISPPQSPQTISSSHISGDHTHRNLEQLLDSSLATVAVIISGNTLADVLTPRAYDTIKALYALAAPASSTNLKPGESEIPTGSKFSDFGNDCFYSSESPPLPNPSLAVPRNGIKHISEVLFSWAGLAPVSFLVLISIWLGFQVSSCERS